MNELTVSCCFPPSSSVPDYIALAEKLGYRRAWCYDSPALYDDVWMILAAAATRTNTIGLGPAVLVPSLRHPVVTASAVLTLQKLAPSRVAIAIGAGFSGRRALGKPPVRWAVVEEYIKVTRRLLAGERVDWDGRVVQLLHPDSDQLPGSTVPPILVGADGPVGRDVARTVGDGLVFTSTPARGLELPEWCALILLGTVLDPWENLETPRVQNAARYAAGAAYHMVYAKQGAERVGEMPGGKAWLESVQAEPVATRHLLEISGHLTEASEADRAAFAESPSFGATRSFTGRPAQLRERLGKLRDRGITEIVFQPAEPDVERELRAFAQMARLNSKW